MRAVIRQLLIVLSVFVTVARVGAADAEGRAFTNAVHQFQDGFHARAELAFSNLVAQFPESPRVPEALLFQARAALSQQRFQPASDLLTTNMARAGALADQFKYWLGRVQLDSGKSDAAAGTFAQFNNTFTNSPLRLDAAIGEAEARFSLKQWPAVMQLIEAPGAFQSAAAVRTNDVLVARGYFLLARALFQLQLLDRAELALNRIGDATPDPRLRWERQFLLCQIQFRLGRVSDALMSATNLVNVARINADPQLRAASIALQGDILHAANEAEAATRTYEANLVAGVPMERQREAFVKTVQIALERNQLSNAASRMENFLAEHPTETGADVALLSLGELRLKQFQLGTNAGAIPNLTVATNLTQAAIDNFERLVRDFPKSPFAAQAQLGRGWALLVQEKKSEALAAFRAAAEALPKSDAQAVARFKLADLQFASGDITNAVQSYRSVVRDYTEYPRVQHELVDRALYQMLQASIAARDKASATEAISRITAEYPKSAYAERGLLLFGQALTELAAPAEARKTFGEFVQLFPDSTLVPEAGLAVARSYEREGKWTNAVQQYSAWLAKNSTNENVPRAEFCRAVALFQSGAERDAVAQFTNFVARFPTNLLAARAQNWIGDYYFNRGLRGEPDADQQFLEAERNYLLLFTERTISTNWPVTELTFAARLKAGHAAFRRQSWDQALYYFTNLTSSSEADVTCPSIVSQAVFAYGDTTIQRPGPDALDRFSKAREIFEYIPKRYPQDPNVPRALARMADCYLQLASADANYYTNAYDHYRKVTNAPDADIATRSAAEFGMGEVRRKQAAGLQGAEAMQMQRQALDHYLNVAYKSNLRDGERPDLIWVRDAALAAARLCESQKNWELASKLYRRIAEMIPALRETMETKINKATEQQSSQKP